MKNSNLLKSSLLALLVLPGIALAESAHTVSSNVSFATDYLFRGLTQTGAKPAIQGGMDYAHTSGLYAGAWGSNISWLSDTSVSDTASLELDTYVGYSSSFAGDFGYDVGYLRYNYPGSYGSGATKGDTDEIYGALSWNWLTAKYSYSLGDTFGFADAKGSSYIEVSASYTIADAGVDLGVHYGKQTFKGAGNSLSDYSDYNVSASKDFNGYVVGLTYSATDTKKGAGEAWYITAPVSGSSYDMGKGTAVLSVSHAM